MMKPRQTTPKQVNWICVPLALILMLTGCASQDNNLFAARRKSSSAAVVIPAYPGVTQKPATTNLGTLAGMVNNGSVGTGFKVGVLLPLTGAHAALGQAMLNAAQMAVFDGGGGNLTLLPRDTGDDPATAVAAMRSASANGAQLMIGPLFATQVAAVKAAAQGKNISILALSNDASLAAPGVYIVGFTPAAQVKRVMRYAMAHGVAHGAALIPTGAYGDLVAAALQDVMAHHNGITMRMARYASHTTDFRPVLQEIAEERGQLDALLIADGGTNLHRIAAALPDFQLNDPRIRLLGTGLWDEDNLGRRDPQLIGGWYAAPDPQERKKFFGQYQAVYGAQPPRLVTLSHDATALAGVLAQRGGRVDPASLTNPAGFAGVDGIFRFAYDGVSERGLAIMQVAVDEARLLDPGPKIFGGGGN